MQEHQHNSKREIMKLIFLSFFLLLQAEARPLSPRSSDDCAPDIQLRDIGGNTVFQCKPDHCSDSNPVQWKKDGEIVMDTELEEASIQGNRVVFTGTNISHEANWTCSDGSQFSENLPYFVSPSADDINVTLTQDNENYIQTPSVIHLGDLSRRYLGFTVDVIHLPDCDHDPSVSTQTRVLTGQYQPGGMQVISNDRVSLDLGNFSIRYKVPENTSRLCLRCELREFSDNFKSQTSQFNKVTSDITIGISADVDTPTQPPSEASSSSVGIITTTVQCDETKEHHYSVEFSNSDCRKADVDGRVLIRARDHLLCTFLSCESPSMGVIEVFSSVPFTEAALTDFFEEEGYDVTITKILPVNHVVQILTAITVCAVVGVVLVTMAMVVMCLCFYKKKSKIGIHQEQTTQPSFTRGTRTRESAQSSLSADTIELSGISHIRTPPTLALATPTTVQRSLSLPQVVSHSWLTTCT